MENERQVFTVSQVNTMARTFLEQIAVWVEGEIDGYEDGYAHAVYFQLKDGKSVLPCIFWKSDEIFYFPKNGEKVLIFGNLTLYEKTGKYQMKVSKIEAFGEGDLLRKREELRKKLQSQGYFSEEAKRPIPTLCQKIGLITSKRGAAIEDFKTNVVKGYEGLEIYFVDSLVQGDSAVKSICDGLKRLSKEKLDVVVLTRGGGDIEDLMCFNTEEVVKAIRACPFPVISAVGHEIDYTLADLAADLRVSTPTKAAELISSSYINFRVDLRNTFDLISSRLEEVVKDVLQELDYYEDSLKRVWMGFKNLPSGLADFLGRLTLGFHRVLSQEANNLNLLFEKVNALGPNEVLRRGYSIAYGLNGKVVKSIEQVSLGDKLDIKISDGTLGTKVLERKHE